MSLAKRCFFGDERFSLPVVVKLLLDAGADVNTGDCGFTPLQLLLEEVSSILYLTN